MIPSQGTQKSIYKLAPVALALSLAACGGTGQDIGKTETYSQTFRGVAIDGHLARAMVFVDYDNNGTRDQFEPYAFTDNSGYYSYNPETDTDYCASGVSSQEALYCLQVNRPLETAVIRIDGGYDVLTGEPFVGQLSRREFLNKDGATVNSVVSPLTTALSHAKDRTQRDRLLSTLDVSETDLDVDYFNSDGSGGINTRLMNKAIKLHKVVSVLSDSVTDTYTEIGSALGTANDLSSSIYKHLTNSAREQNLTLASVLNNPQFLAEVVLKTEADTRSLYENRGFDIPLPVNGVSALATTPRTSINAANIADIVDVVLGADEFNINRTNAVGRARALEAVVIKALQEGAGSDASIDSATQFFLNINNNDLIDALITSLSEDNADLAGFVHNDFSGEDFDSAEEITQATQLPEGTVPFSDIAGFQLKVSDLDLGVAPYNLKDSEVEAYFNGEPGDTSGTFSACVKYIEDAHSDGTLGEANTRGELVNGYWSLLEGNSGATYSLLLTIEFLGATYQAIIKPAGPTTIDGMSYTRFRFDNGDEIRTWHSADALQPVATVPSTNKACEARLPSRIGIY